MKRETSSAGDHAPAKEVASRFMSSRFTLIYCLAVLLLFGILSYTAALRESATVDEPTHVMSSYVALRHGDFRVEPDHPPLWKYWAAAPLLVTDVNPRMETTAFRMVPANVQAVWSWCVGTLYQTPGNDADRILSRARFMMMLVGVALGALTARFAYRVAGPVAACVAVTLFAFDPNFLAHAPLVKNDVPLALCTTALAYALYLACLGLTWRRVLTLGACCAACVTTKLTGLLAGPMVAVVLFARALGAAHWPARPAWGAGGESLLATRRKRLLAAAGVCVGCFLFTYVAIWAVYLFRFSPSPDPAVHYNTAQFLGRAARADLAVSTGRSTVTPEEFAAWRPDLSMRLGLWALDHRLLPEPFLNGVIFAASSNRGRYSFALGSTYVGGRWYYFPFAFLVKTPLTTLAVLVAALLLFVHLLKKGWRPRASRSLLGHPAVLALSVPLVVFLAATLPAGVNIGLRHILPVYPLIFVAAAIPLARLWALRPRLARALYPVLGICLVVESVANYPHFIPFFNAAVGGPRAGVYLLGDSNLDWGQDLPLLADWQRRNPNRTLHLAYTGTADPAYYHIRYHNLPHGYHFGAQPPSHGPLPTTGVLAISASTLQRTEYANSADPPYTFLLRFPPAEVLGHSIYLYDLGGE